ncbi:hypothetical protein BN1708_003482 [Verticillium longisporum]|uniref:Uncharacterized protein n=1 Tax=Verticillium longisporum TaxID=100787 RepID=A0A0G4LIQ1_VERLO|nr:hypothetical protein BN1708_003482 [Verticillium longisporum]
MDREGDYSREGQAYYGRSVTGGPAPSAATTAATTPQYRPGTPNTDNAGRNPFGDGLESQASDGKSEKPWLNGSPNAKKDFWEARDTWLPTWTKPELEIKHVKIWQQCNGDEEL